jgi:hypothetical protein
MPPNCEKRYANKKMFTFVTRAWLCYLVVAAQKAGLTPISKTRLHRLVFLSNCLAPLFQATPNSSRIVKYVRGPFYPVIQWELDRLATMGVLDISDLRYIKDGDGWWRNTSYDCGPFAVEITRQCNRLSYGQELEAYLVEVAFGYSSLNERVLEAVALKDANYNRPGLPMDSFIDFSEPERNLSVKLARSFANYTPQRLIPTRKEELFLYMRFLEAVAEVRAA